MNKIKYTLISFLLFVFSQAKEISVFDAGNMTVSTPYGMTKAEKISYDNTEKIRHLLLKIDYLNSKQDELFQKIEGISSLFESDSKNSQNIKLNLKNSENKLIDLLNKTETNINKIRDLDKKLDDFISLQKENNRLQEETNLKLVSIVNKINGEYVKKIEFDELVSYINISYKPNEKYQASKNEKKSINLSEKQSNKEIFEDAIKFFKMNQLAKSLEMFEKIASEKYKIAETNFYIGEIKFKQKIYKEAIQFYKQSMIADDKAIYIPQLLLHSALCFEGMKENDSADKFYKTIIDIYPDSLEAKEASKKLKKGKRKNDKK